MSRCTEDSTVEEVRFHAVDSFYILAHLHQISALAALTRRSFWRHRWTPLGDYGNSKCVLVSRSVAS